MKKKRKLNNKNSVTTSCDLSETDVLDEPTSTNLTKNTIIIKDNKIVNSHFNSNMTICDRKNVSSEKKSFREKFETFVEKFKDEIGYEISHDFKNLLTRKIIFDVRDLDHLLRSLRKLHNYCENNLTNPSLSFITCNDLDFVEELVKFLK